MCAYPAIQISMIVLSAMSGSALYYKTRNPYYLAGVAMMTLIGPYTRILLNPIDEKLLDIRKHGRDDPQVESMLIRWDALHFGRTILSFGAMTVTLYAALRA